MKKKAFIILSFVENLDKNQLLDFAENSDCVICADGGQVIARKYGIVPDCVIGDFDSTENFERFSCLYITFPIEKDLTDTEAAINYAIEDGCSSITIYGGIGGRLDHTVGNIGLLEKFSLSLDHLEFIDGKNKISLINSAKDTDISVTCNNRFKYISLMPLDECAKDISISGAKYELSHIDILRASTMCISNEFKDDIINIHIGDGKVLLIQSNE